MKLAKIFAGYGTASLVQGATGFVSVPILIGVLGQQGFASWALLEPIIAIAAAIALLGAHHGHLQAIVTGRISLPESFSLFFRKGLILAVFISLVIGASVAWMLELESMAFGAVQLGALFLMEAIILLLQFQSRALSQAVTYAATIWIRSALSVGSIMIAFRLNVVLSLQDYICIVTANSGAVLLLVSVNRGRAIKAAFLITNSNSWEEVRRHIAYGAPIVVASLLAAVVATGDRFVVNSMMSRDELPAYVVMAKLGGALAFASAPINLWWPVARHQHTSDDDGGRAFFRSATPVLFAYYIVTAATLWVASCHLVDVYAPGVIGFDSSALLILLLGALALGMTAPVSIGTLAQGHTHWTVISVALSAICGLLAALVLIPSFGYRGAAAATFVAQVINLLSGYIFSQRIYPVRLYSHALCLTGLCGSALIFGLWNCSSNISCQLGLLVVGVFAIFIFIRNDLRALLERA